MAICPSPDRSGFAVHQQNSMETAAAESWRKRRPIRLLVPGAAEFHALGRAWRGVAGTQPVYSGQGGSAKLALGVRQAGNQRQARNHTDPADRQPGELDGSPASGSRSLPAPPLAGIFAGRFQVAAVVSVPPGGAGNHAATGAGDCETDHHGTRRRGAIPVRLKQVTSDLDRRYRLVSLMPLNQRPDRMMVSAGIRSTSATARRATVKPRGTARRPRGATLATAKLATIRALGVVANKTPPTTAIVRGVCPDAPERRLRARPPTPPSDATPSPAGWFGRIPPTLPRTVRSVHQVAERQTAASVDGLHTTGHLPGGISPNPLGYNHGVPVPGPLSRYSKRQTGRKKGSNRGPWATPLGQNSALEA